MRKEKTTNRAAAMCLWMLSALCLASCIKNDYISADRATVTMTFTTRVGDNTSLSGEQLTDNEQMKTLRVIVARKSGEIVYNVKYDIQPEETNKVITFSELTVDPKGEMFDFYAMANEESFLAVGESLDGKDINLTKLYGGILTGPFRLPLPQTAYKEVEVKPQNKNEESMNLTFPAGKICLKFINHSGKEARLTNVSIPGVTPQGSYLFDHNGEVPPAMTQNRDIRFGTNGSITIPVGTEVSPQEVTEIHYAHPGTAGEGKYKLSAGWNGAMKTLLLATPDEPNGISSIARGQQLNITVILNPGAIENMELTFEVIPWTDKEIDVPSFQ